MLYLTNSELKGGYPLPPKEWLEIVPLISTGHAIESIKHALASVRE